jgi:hypothetical protein
VAGWCSSVALTCLDSEISFHDDQSRKYKWKGLGSGRSVEVSYLVVGRCSNLTTLLSSQMYAEDDHFHAPIARYTRTYRKPVPADDPKSEAAPGRPGFIHTPGELALLPRALEIQELVVLTHLFQEKQYRLKYGGGAIGGVYEHGSPLDNALAGSVGMM